MTWPRWICRKVVVICRGKPDRCERNLGELPGARVPSYPKTMMALGESIGIWAICQGGIPLHGGQGVLGEDLGDQYPLYVINLIDLARLAWERDAYHQADSLYAQASVIGRRRLANAVHYMSERNWPNSRNSGHPE